MAYGMGAVAPILYTGAVMVADVPGKLTDPFMSLPYHLYMLVNNGFSLDKTTPRLIQFHTFKNAVNPPFLGGFSIFGTVAA